ncbi:MAG: hypothetical protein LBH16_09755 [Treponema sp.]|jgi:hypothetical protein|nr:hypothetical protein [Treponema sp.]
MNDELMDAECVIQKLFDKRLITMREWQNQHSADQDYSVYFQNPGNLSADIGIYIIKRSGRYFVLRSLVAVLSYRHHFNAEHIYNDCAV